MFYQGNAIRKPRHPIWLIASLLVIILLAIMANAYGADDQKGYTGFDVDDAYSQWQIDAMEAILPALKELGAEVHPTSVNKKLKDKDFGFTLDVENKWHKPPIRDRIEFGNIVILKGNTKEGDPVILESKDDGFIYEDLENTTDHTSLVRITVEESETISEQSSESSLHGWDIRTSVTGTVGANESNKVEVSVEAGAKGEYTKASESGKEQTRTITKEIEHEVPPFTTFYVQQTKEKAKVRVTSQQKIYFDVAFTYIGKRHFPDSPLRDYKKANRFGKTQSRYLIRVESLNELHRILSGKHGDYPKLRTNLLTGKGHPKTKAMWKWLSDENNRYIRAEEIKVYDNASVGHSKVVEKRNKDEETDD